MDKLLSRLSTPQAVRSQILIYLFAARVYNSAKLAYESLFRQFQCESAIKLQSEDIPPLPLSASSSPSSLSISDDGTKDEIRVRLLDARRDSSKDSSRFPRKWCPISRYERFSTYYMIYVVLVKFILPIDWIISLFVAQDQPQKPYNCYILGVVVFTPSLARIAGALFCSFHLVRRFLESNSRPYITNLVLLLIQDEQDLISSYEGLKNGHSSYLDSQLTAQERLLRHALCYKITLRSNIVYCLRPNRRKQDFERLRKFAGKCFLFSIVLFVLVLGFMLQVTIRFILFDTNYLVRYAGCDAELEKLYHDGQLDYYSVTLTDRRILTVIFDTIENFVIYLDSGISITIVAPLVVLLNYDLINSWRVIDEKIRSLAERAELDYHCGQQKAGEQSDIGSIRINNSMQEEYQRKMYISRYVKDSKFEREILQLQAEVSDFFGRVQEVDTLVSDEITIISCAWVSNAVMMSYLAVAGTGNEPLQAEVQLSQIYPFIIYTMVGFYLLQMSKNILNSYNRLCTLIAYDQSRFKWQFIEILNFYSMRKRHAYTLFRQYPFLSTTYLTIIGWTFSASVFVQTVYKSYLIHRK